MPASPPERKVAAGAVAMLAATQVVYGLTAGPLAGLLFAGDPSQTPSGRWFRSLALSGAFAMAALAIAAVASFAALGLVRGAGWGWWVCVVLSALLIPTGCAPVAVVVLVLLNRPGVRPTPAAG